MGYVVNPQLKNITDQIDQTDQTDTSDADNYYKQIVRGLGRKGHDVGTIDAFQPMLQAGATQQRQAAESQQTGDSGLMMATGTPEQKALLDRQNEIGNERIKEGTGMAIADAVPGMLSDASAYGEQQAQDANSFALNKFATKTGAINQNSQYRASPWLNFLPGLTSGAVKGAAALI